MNAKRVLPLALLYAADSYRIRGRTRFQKLAFLAEQRLEDEGISAYDFIPYDYGPFTDDLYIELEFLRDKGLVEESRTRTYGGDERYDYKLTREGRQTFEQNIPEEPSSPAENRFETLTEVANDVVSEYNSIPISNLLKYVYEEYPEYAENSVLY